MLLGNLAVVFHCGSNASRAISISISRPPPFNRVASEQYSIADDFGGENRGPQHGPKRTSPGYCGLDTSGGPGGWEGKGLQPLPTTQFPQAVGLGETWDPDLIRQVAAVEGYEARYIFN